MNNDNLKKISLGSIKYLTKQLHDFVETYEKYILMNNEEKKIFEELKKISYLLDHQRYDVLIALPQYVIDFTDDNNDYLPDYYPI